MTYKNGGVHIKSICETIRKSMKLFNVVEVIAKGPYLELWFLSKTGLCGDFVNKTVVKEKIKSHPYSVMDLNDFGAPKATSHEPILECREHIAWMESVDIFNTK